MPVKGGNSDESVLLNLFKTIKEQIELVNELCEVETELENEINCLFFLKHTFASYA